MPEETQRAAAVALERAGALPERLRAAGMAPMGGLELRVAPVGGGVGEYDPYAKLVRAGTPADLAKNFAPKESPVAWATNYWTQSAERSAALTAVHEFGHHVHYELRELARRGAGAQYERAEETIRAAYRRAVPDARSHLPSVEETARLGKQPAGAAPTRYARQSYEEFWSESFTAYREERTWLERERPIAFTMVRDVLREIGLEEP